MKFFKLDLYVGANSVSCSKNILNIDDDILERDEYNESELGFCDDLFNEDEWKIGKAVTPDCPIVGKSYQTELNEKRTTICVMALVGQQIDDIIKVARDQIILHYYHGVLELFERLVTVVQQIEWDSNENKKESLSTRVLQKKVDDNVNVIKCEDNWDGDDDELTKHITFHNVVLDTDQFKWKDVKKGVLLHSDGYRDEQFYFGILMVYGQWFYMDLMDGVMQLIDVNEESLDVYVKSLEQM